MNESCEVKTFTNKTSLRTNIVLTGLLLSPIFVLFLVPAIAVACSPKYHNNWLPVILATVVTGIGSKKGFTLIFYILILPFTVVKNKKYKLEVTQNGFRNAGDAKTDYIPWKLIRKASFKDGDFNLTKLLVLEIESSGTSAGAIQDLHIPWPLEPRIEFQEYIIQNLSEENPLRELFEITERKMRLLPSNFYGKESGAN